MTVVIREGNPTDDVEATFFRIYRDRMADVPINNPALSVEAIDFQRWQGHWLGVLVTPWCMSLMLIPGKTEGWVSVRDNGRRFLRFPSGDFAFLGSEEDGLGEFQTCALFSPMSAFANQDEARLTARASMVALMQPRADDSGASAAASETPPSTTISATNDSANSSENSSPNAAQQASPQQPPSTSRRRFLSAFARPPSGNRS